MKVEGIPEEGIVFGIQIPEEDVWVQLFLLLMKRLKPFFGLIRRIVNPCHENRKTRQANNGLDWKAQNRRQTKKRIVRGRGRGRGKGRKPEAGEVSAQGE